MLRSSSTLRLTSVAGLLLSMPVFAQLPPTVISRPLTTPGAPYAITVGPDGALWFTNDADIGRIAANAIVTQYPDGYSLTNPEGLVTGSDGALWYTDFNASGIRRITTQGVPTFYALSSGVNPQGIAAGPDGALWFTEFSGANIGRIATDGTVTTYPGLLRAWGIAAGSDGALWFTQNSTYIADYGNNIGRITTDGVLTTYAVPSGPSGLAGITAGPDGALWFTENYLNQIGRITTSGVVTEYPIPTADSMPQGIVTGADGALWFTETSGNNIGRITTDGTITEYAVPTAATYPGGPEGIAALPDGTIWFANSGGNAIGEVVFPTVSLLTTAESVGPGSVITVTGSGFSAGESVNLYSNSTGTNLFETVTADASGTFSALLTVPELPNGTNAAVAVGQTGGKLGVAYYYVDLSLAPGQIFADVPPSAYYYTAVNLLDTEGITAGCGVDPALYCPTENVTRAEMAIFIVRAIYGNDDFSYNSAPYFTDVPANAFGFQWIQKLYELGITAGCGGGDYCPDDLVTRDEMAIMIVRARYGATTIFTWNPVPYFVDVPSTYYAFSWIQRLYQDGITSGCLASPLSYCPESPVSRGDMAILITRRLPLSFSARIQKSR